MNRAASSRRWDSRRARATRVRVRGSDRMGSEDKWGKRRRRRWGLRDLRRKERNGARVWADGAEPLLIRVCRV